MTGVLMKRGHGGTPREESHVKAVADCTGAWKPGKVKGHQQLREAGRKQEGFLPRAFRGSIALPTPGFWISPSGTMRKYIFVV